MNDKNYYQYKNKKTYNEVFWDSDFLVFIYLLIGLIIIIVLYVLIMSSALNSAEIICEREGGTFTSSVAGKIVTTKCQK